MKYTHKDPNASGVACKFFLPSGIVVGTNLTDIPLELDDTTTTLTNSSTASDVPLLMASTNPSGLISGGGGGGDRRGLGTNSSRGCGSDANIDAETNANSDANQPENTSSASNEKDRGRGAVTHVGYHSRNSGGGIGSSITGGARMSSVCLRGVDVRAGPTPNDEETHGGKPVVDSSAVRSTGALPTFSTVVTNSAPSSVSLADVLPSSVLITPTSVANGGGIALCRQQQQQHLLFQNEIRQQQLVLKHQRAGFPPPRLQQPVSGEGTATESTAAGRARNVVQLPDGGSSSHAMTAAAAAAAAAAAFMGNSKFGAVPFRQRRHPASDAACSTVISLLSSIYLLTVPQHASCSLLNLRQLKP